MITLNKKKFAANAAEFKAEPEGTFAGFYRVYKRCVSLLDTDKVKIGVISNNVCGTASKLNGKWWYSYGTPSLIGEWDTYTARMDDIRAITERFELAVKY